VGDASHAGTPECDAVEVNLYLIVTEIDQGLRVRHRLGQIREWFEISQSAIRAEQHWPENGNATLDPRRYDTHRTRVLRGRADGLD
jgi:hypothetical protein